MTLPGWVSRTDPQSGCTYYYIVPEQRDQGDAVSRESVAPLVAAGLRHHLPCTVAAQLTTAISELFGMRELVENSTRVETTSCARMKCGQFSIGVNLAYIVLGLCFATCALSSSILYTVCNCYEPLL
jgi:hypothetical protein